ncbi:MAG TPA: pilus assembly protein TadG-related protein, partial [Anaerolineales bacterium]|nr:pilus assembly protein TadG-related protein [Anaerolineales bacterium]
MNPTQKPERGQVLIIFVFAIIGLIAIAGLAIDGGNIYSDRSRARNAADAAALAGAMVKVNEQIG